MKSFLSKAAGLVGQAAPSQTIAADQHPPKQQQQSGGVPTKPDPVLDNLLRNVRSKHVRRQFFTHARAEYTETKDVKILAGTYNVAGKRSPPGLKLHEWLEQWKSSWPAQAGSKKGSEGPDMVIIGFQEVVPLSAGNVIAGPTSDGADAWDFALAATLNGDEWASRNFGRTFGSPLASQAMYLSIERLGSQAAYAYSVISSQANQVVSAMDKMWAGGQEGLVKGPGGVNAAGELIERSASAADQQARLQAAIESEEAEEAYVQVSCKQMVGLYLSVWARKRLARHIRGVQATLAATGFGGYLGNKGAVSIRLRVFDAPLCLVCSHLASGDQDGDELKRNADVMEILKRCAFSTDAELAAAGMATGEGDVDLMRG
eukprot:jgi/Chrzof1/7761/Cz02g35230.t1